MKNKTPVIRKKYKFDLRYRSPKFKEKRFYLALFISLTDDVAHKFKIGFSTVMPNYACSQLALLLRQVIDQY